MKKQSVEVLDSADDFGRKLSWQLFQQEVDYIWGGGEGEWRPGDPLFEPTRSDWPEACNAFLNETPRCEPCGVSWPGDEPCWMCGEERRYPEVESLQDIFNRVYPPPRAREFLSMHTQAPWARPIGAITEAYNDRRNAYEFRIDGDGCYSALIVSEEDIVRMGPEAREIIHESLRLHLRRQMAGLSQD